MVRASHCVGLTLPGMMLEPGSFSGRFSSFNPQRGPLASSLYQHAHDSRDTSQSLLLTCNPTDGQQSQEQDYVLPAAHLSFWQPKQNIITMQLL